MKCLLIAIAITLTTTSALATPGAEQKPLEVPTVTRHIHVEEWTETNRYGERFTRRAVYRWTILQYPDGRREGIRETLLIFDPPLIAPRP